MSNGGNMALNAEQKVLLIEKTVLDGSKEDIINIIKENAPFEFTARALAYACRYRDLEIVKCLVQNGFTFQYEYSSALEKKYKVAFGTKTQKTPTDYMLLPLPDLFVNPHYNDFEGETAELVFSNVYMPRIKAALHDYLKWDLEDRYYTETRTRVSNEELVKILLYLDNNLPDFDIEKAYYYSILVNPELAVLINNKQISLKENQILDILSYDQKNIEGLEYRNLLLAAYFKGDLDKSVDLLCTECKRYGKSFKIYPQLTKKIILEGNVQVLEPLLKLNCLGSFNKKQAVESLIDNGNEAAIAMLLDYQMIETKELEKFLDVITEKKLASINAIILEKKKDYPTCDVFSTMAIKDPSPSELQRKMWSTKKLEDGSLVITSYKGDEVDILVPSAIGRSQVSEIGQSAFSPSVYPNHLSKQQINNRRKIHLITISEGIRHIQENAFEWCKQLETVILPESMLTIGAGAFSGCYGLKKIVIPSGVYNIASSAFRKSLIDDSPIDGLSIYGEKGSYAEQYALENGIAFKNIR